jgi:hypothetical protein
MQRRHFVGSGLALAASWPLRGISSALKSLGDVPARSLAGGEIVLPGSAIEALAAGLRGEVLLAGSPDYDRTRRVWNASFDKKPALIARCTGASDVQRAVLFAREHQVLTAVRAGGHSYSGKSSCDGGLIIDLQLMQGVRIDPEARRAWLESGSLLGQLDHECAAFRLARDVLRYYRDIALDAPDVVNLAPAVYSEPDGPETAPKARPGSKSCVLLAHRRATPSRPYPMSPYRPAPMSCWRLASIII